DYARAYGYGLSERLAKDELPSVPQSENDRELTKLPPERQLGYKNALLGDMTRVTAMLHDEDSHRDPDIAVVHGADGSVLTWDRRSCVAQAHQQVEGDDYARAVLEGEANALHLRMSEQVRTDARVEAGHRKWRACMGVHGLSYDEPGAAAGVLSEQYADGMLTRSVLMVREREIASIDAQCVAASGIEEAQAAANTEARERLAQASQPLLARVQAQKQRARSRAREILAGVAY
ncbi:MAG: hypothetical protein ABW321_28585, partial [Polyangiales bacterium]